MRQTKIFSTSMLFLPFPWSTSINNQNMHVNTFYKIFLLALSKNMKPIFFAQNRQSAKIYNIGNIMTSFWKYHAQFKHKSMSPIFVWHNHWKRETQIIKELDFVQWHGFWLCHGHYQVWIIWKSAGPLSVGDVKHFHFLVEQLPGFIARIF